MASEFASPTHAMAFEKTESATLDEQIAILEAENALMEEKLKVTQRPSFRAAGEPEAAASEKHEKHEAVVPEKQVLAQRNVVMEWLQNFLAGFCIPSKGAAAA